MNILETCHNEAAANFFNHFDNFDREDSSRSRGAVSDSIEQEEKEEDMGD